MWHTGVMTTTSTPASAAATAVLIEEPSRSKQGGPCWISIDGVGYLTRSTKDLSHLIGQSVAVTGKAVLRRATRTSTDRRSWTVEITGDPSDTVDLAVAGDYLTARLVGARAAGQ